MAEVKEEHQPRSSWEPPDIKEEPELCIKQEPGEFPFHVVSVKTEDDEDKSSVIHQTQTEENREETNGSSSDTDDSDNWSLQQAPVKNYTMAPPDSVTDLAPFTCSDGGKSFTTNSDFQSHRSIHSGKRSHKCSVCEKTFSQKGYLKTHMKIHTGEKPFVCSVCEKGFVKKTDLTRHQGLIHHICPVCKAGLSDKNDLNEHLRTHKMQRYDQWCKKPVSCSECGKMFWSKANLKRHMFVHGKETTSDLQKHGSVHSRKRSHKCSVCEKTFSQKGNLKTHMKIHTGEKPFVCSVCVKGFVKKTDLTRHQGLIHHICPVCSERLTDKNSLCEHLRTHEDEGTIESSSYLFREIVKSFPGAVCGQRPHKCSVCEKAFSQKGSLNVHMKIHTGEKRFICSPCEKGFVKKTDLTRHQRLIHHICPVCSERLTDRKSLKEHLRIHVEDGTLKSSSPLFRKKITFSCPYCGKSFARNSVLQNHLSVHCGKRPHKYLSFRKTFAENDCDKMQTKNHTGQNAFVCSVCDKGFVNESDFTRHQRLVHHICPVCYDRLTDRITFNKHLRSHLEEGTLEQSSVILRALIKPFSCSDCGRGFKSNSVLKYHMSFHSGNRPHKCSISGKTCPEKVYRKIQMKIHTKDKLNKSNFIQSRRLLRQICPVCSECFTHRIHLNKHLKAHVEEGTLDQSSLLLKPFSCTECGQNFSLKSLLQSHMFAHTEVRPHKCSVCEKSFQEERLLSRHLKQGHSFCPVCEAVFPGKIKLNQHLRAHVKEGSLDQSFLKPYSCPECGKNFKSKGHLQSLMFVHTQVSPHRCSVCQKSFMKISHLTQHLMHIHHICPICYSGFSDNNDLTEHLRTHKKQRLPDLSHMKPFSCSECGKMFKSKANLERHMFAHREETNSDLQKHRSVHSGKRSHKCSVCEKTFSQKGYLKTHMKIHTGEKPFVCSVCEKGFVKKTDLTRHQGLIHHICPVCSERLTDRNSLCEHLRTHEDEGTLKSYSSLFTKKITFSCPYCGKSFARNSVLQNHLSVHCGKRPHKYLSFRKTFAENDCDKMQTKIHTGQNAFVCSVCDKGFVNESDFTRHQRLVHHICPVCYDRLTDRITFNKHLRSHLEEGTLEQSSVILRALIKPFSCSDCGRNFKSNSVLKYHMSFHSGNRPHKCSISGKTCPEKVYRKIQIKIHTKDKLNKSNLTQSRRLLRQICPVCSECFTHRIHLNKHLKAHVEEGTLEQSSLVLKPFSCTECGQNFSLKSLLQSHMFAHTEVRPHKCSVCEKSFQEERLLSRHLKQGHSFCPVCEAVFPGKIKLNQHLRAHVKEGSLDQSFLKPYSCPECGKNFKSKGHLQSLMFVHTQVSPHRCSVCQQGFMKISHLTQHLMHIHHICPICEAGFSDKNDVTEHLRTHKKQRLPDLSHMKPFSCSECGKMFKTKANLKRHMFAHREERPFKCVVCGRDFKLICNLRIHMRTHKTNKTPARSKPFCAAVCGKDFDLKRNLETPLKSHSEHKPFVCSVCEQKFELQTHLEDHKATHIRERQVLILSSPTPIKIFKVLGGPIALQIRRGDWNVFKVTRNEKKTQ